MENLYVDLKASRVNRGSLNGGSTLVLIMARSPMEVRGFLYEGFRQ